MLTDFWAFVWYTTFQWRTPLLESEFPKDFGVPEKDLQAPTWKRIRMHDASAADEELEAIQQDLGSLYVKIGNIFTITKHMQPGLKLLLSNAVKCTICLETPVKPPLIMAKCYKSILGCLWGVNGWCAAGGLTKCCPSCRLPRGLSDTMVLLGLDELGQGMTDCWRMSLTPCIRPHVVSNSLTVSLCMMWCCCQLLPGNRQVVCLSATAVGNIHTTSNCVGNDVASSMMWCCCQLLPGNRPLVCLSVAAAGNMHATSNHVENDVASCMMHYCMLPGTVANELPATSHHASGNIVACNCCQWWCCLMHGGLRSITIYIVHLALPHI